LFAVIWALGVQKSIWGALKFSRKEKTKENMIGWMLQLTAKKPFGLASIKI
jgi:hypothetical protein